MAPPPPGSFVQCGLDARGVSCITHQLGRYPVKFLARRSRRGAEGKAAPDCAHVAVLNYGGGILGGEALTIAAGIGTGAALHLHTPGSTKVFKRRGPGGGGAAADGASSNPDPSPSSSPIASPNPSPSPDPPTGRSEQRLHLRGRSGSLTAFLPHHVCAFADARYRQVQRFELERGASLVFLDWLSAGRSGRGERWDFAAVQSANVVSYGGHVLFNDCLELRGGDLEARLHAMEVVGAICVIGARARAVTTHLLRIRDRDSFGDVQRRSAKRRRANSAGEATEGEALDWEAWRDRGVLFSFCELGGDGATIWDSTSAGDDGANVDEHGLYVLRFAAPTMPLAYAFVRFCLAPLEAEIGLQPFSTCRPT